MPRVDLLDTGDGIMRIDRNRVFCATHQMEKYGNILTMYILSLHQSQEMLDLDYVLMALLYTIYLLHRTPVGQ